jgi:lipopolysaccharide export system protein LptA
MRRLSLTALGIGLVLTAAPSVASAQQTCDQVLPSNLRRVITETGQEIIYYRDPVRMICTGGVQIEADSAVMNSAANTVELVGRVLYRDGERQLTSAWAQYFSQTDELFARGTVVLTDMADGSVISGEEFEYRRETEERPEAHMLIWGGRPHAELRRAPEGSGDAGAPIQVWAQRLELIGEAVFLADTDVELERQDMRGASDFARFDQSAERMTLTGNAHVETDEYRLEGGRIDAFMNGDALREVLSEEKARLVAEDLTVHGRNIRIGFLDGDPQRVEAWTPAATDTAEQTTARPERAVAISRDFRLRADSIDARSLGGRLREVQAVGRAYGEREADTLSVQLPDAIARDWIQGDTITGYFAHDETIVPDPDAERDPADDVVLERIEVIGGNSDALSLYRTEAPRESTRPAVNFMRARRITLFMSEGEVSRVEADGPMEGLYLDPARAPDPPREAPGSTIAGRGR